jgi:predicted amidohydrolase YtcJ
MQPEHIGLIERSHYNFCIGEERVKYTFPVNSLIESGAKMIFGSDYPIVELNPMLEIYRAVSRMAEDQKPWNEKEAISVTNALKAYTTNAAYSAFKENELGTLEVGKLADIIVIDRNIFVVPPEEIKTAKVKLTIMDGRVIYEE